MVALAFDTLQFARKLKASGFPEALAEAFKEAQAENLVTKLDLERAELALSSQIAVLAKDLSLLKTQIAGLTEEIALFKGQVTNLVQDISALKTKSAIWSRITSNSSNRSAAWTTASPYCVRSWKSTPLPCVRSSPKPRPNLSNG